jgi:hypothetical protein
MQWQQHQVLVLANILCIGLWDIMHFWSLFLWAVNQSHIPVEQRPQDCSVSYCVQVTPISPIKIHHQVTHMFMVMTCQKCNMSQNYAASLRIDKRKAMVIAVHPAHQGCT